MNLYIVICEDRHFDTTAHPFSDPDKAIAEARRIAKESARDPSAYEEHNYGEADGWIFYAEYTIAGDSVRVVTAELDKEI